MRTWDLVWKRNISSLIWNLLIFKNIFLRHSLVCIWNWLLLQRRQIMKLGVNILLLRYRLTCPSSLSWDVLGFLSYLLLQLQSILSLFFQFSLFLFTLWWFIPEKEILALSLLILLTNMSLGLRSTLNSLRNLDFFYLWNVVHRWNKFAMRAHDLIKNLITY